MPKPSVKQSSSQVSQEIVSPPVVEQTNLKKSKESKQKSSSVPEVPVVETPSVPPVTKSDKRSTKKSKGDKDVEPQVVSVPEVADEKPVTKAVEEVDDIHTKPLVDDLLVVGSEHHVTIEQLVSKVKAINSLCLEFTRDLKSLDKSHAKELKVLQKSKFKRRKNSHKPPSGFVKCAVISDEMAHFLGKPHGTLISRTDVTKAIHAYVKQHNLQYPENRRVIMADEKLRTLLNIPQEEIDQHRFTYFKLQSFLKVHFPKQ